MSFLNGIILLDAPASALNNAGSIVGDRTDNKVAVKSIQTREGSYPYVSAQAFRYWLRNTVETKNSEVKFSPITRESKIAYTEANPLEFFDDDLLGYMRAKKGGGNALTRVSPFKTSTLVSISPTRITDDFGVMARHNGDPVPHEHQLYRTTLKGLLSLDLYSSGRFWATEKTGFKNLDEDRIKEAKEQKLEEGQKDSATYYKLSNDERIKRIEALLEGIANLEGGAKQTLHYTDVNPSLLIIGFTKGGNNIFNRFIKANEKGLPVIDKDAIEEILTVYDKEILSPIYVGLPKGYMDSQRDELVSILGDKCILKHPKDLVKDIVDFIKEEPECLD